MQRYIFFISYDKFVANFLFRVHHLYHVKKAYDIEIKKLGKRIKKLRELKGVTQQDLSDLCEVDIRTIQRIEKGEFGSGLHIVYAIADAFKISIAELFNT